MSAISSPPLNIVFPRPLKETLIIPISFSDQLSGFFPLPSPRSFWHLPGLTLRLHYNLYLHVPRWWKTGWQGALLIREERHPMCTLAGGGWWYCRLEISEEAGLPRMSGMWTRPALWFWADAQAWWGWSLWPPRSLAKNVHCQEFCAPGGHSGCFLLLSSCF